jgi:3-methyladenine DNA glycosylase/8-oxoguanine DNA glycosylase
MSYAVAEVDALGERFRPWRTLAAAYLFWSTRVA